MYIDIAKKTVDLAMKLGASHAEAVIQGGTLQLTRYTQNEIHQNLAQKNIVLNLELAVDGNKKGSVSIKSLDDDAIQKSVETALKIAKISLPDTEFQHYAEPKQYRPLDGIYVKSTAELSPQEKAESVKIIIQTALDYHKNVKWSVGAYSTENITYAVVNNLGVEAETKWTRGSVDVITKADDGTGEGSGYAFKMGHDVSEFNFEEVGLAAAKDAVNAINPEVIPLGDYEAILAPEAVTTFTGFIGSLGFSARAYQDGYSCITDRIGSQVFDEKLTIVDEGRNPDTYNALPFDGEGTPKRDLMLINNGVAENLCYDNYTALKDGTESTGHCMNKSRGGFYRGTPLPINQVIEPGDASLEDMIADIKKGVYITRFWYFRSIRRDKAMITGLTRDACWYIENGEIVHPMKVMRFTDSVMDVMSNIDMIGNNDTVQAFQRATIPILKVAKLRFTGQSQF